MTVEPHAYLNGLEREQAAAVLERCCGASSWVRQMLEHRPFRSTEQLQAAALKLWQALPVQQQLEAYAHHPRIGAKQTAALSAKEQAGVAGADPQLMAALHAGNVAYEERFGFVYLVCATGKSAEEMFALLSERLTHDVETELRIAAEEHAKITYIRLQGLGT